MKIRRDSLMNFDVDRVFDPSTLRRKGKVAKCSGYENSLFRPRPRPVRSPRPLSPDGGRDRHRRHGALPRNAASCLPDFNFPSG